ncbi:hypothetical protein [Nonomuraea sp. NPDC049750]|uniref:hypothetical protein n=1 Tax=Nonomuraea sp. NPDC049750 TaxID=3154738 RepID=UPI0033E1B45E
MSAIHPDAATIVMLVQTAGVPFEAFDRVQAYLVVVAVLLRPGMERGGLTCCSRFNWGQAPP